MKSKITSATFVKRFTTAQYEFEELTLSAVVDEKESGAQVLREMKLQIVEAFQGKGAAAVVETETADEVEEPAKEKAAPAKPRGRPKKEKPAVEVVEEEEELEEDDAEVEADDEEEEEEVEETEEEEEEEAPVSAAKKKKFKKAPQTYDRSIEQHKSLFSGLMKEVSPGWNKTEKTQKLAKAASVSLAGEEFLDEDGEVLDAFKAKLKKAMKSK